MHEFTSIKLEDNWENFKDLSQRFESGPWTSCQTAGVKAKKRDLNTVIFGAKVRLLKDIMKYVDPHHEACVAPTPTIVQVRLCIIPTYTGALQAI